MRKARPPARPDPLSPAQRSALMARVRSRGNASTEEAVARALRAHRVTGWLRRTRLPGSPDFYFPLARLALFVHGCFWHGCPRCYRRPKSNVAFWDEKRRQNRARDARVARELRARGIAVITVWEHELKWVAWLRRLRRRLERLRVHPPSRR
jgi:DNA mismatch endonuclease (patch repair protein)